MPMAMRTLGFAYQILDDDAGTAPYADGRLSGADLTFLGFVAISDPVRADVPEAVKCCLEAGVDVKIVTGDTSALSTRPEIRGLGASLRHFLGKDDKS